MAGRRLGGLERGGGAPPYQCIHPGGGGYDLMKGGKAKGGGGRGTGAVLHFISV